MTKAIGYVRRSTDRQEESLEQQRTRLAEFAKAKGWQLVEVFADDAISGSEMKRPGLDKLLQAVADTDAEIVLAWDRNRLARPKDPVDGLMLERQMQRAGKRVIYAATGKEADRSFVSDLTGLVEHHQNGDYLRKLSRDTMRGTVEAAKRGHWPGGPIPFGFDRLLLDGTTAKRIVRHRDDGGQDVIDADTGAVLDSLPRGRFHNKQEHERCTLTPSTPERVRALQRLFTQYAAGIPTRRLRDELNASGMRTSRGGRFTVQTMLPMLENPAYIGRCVYNRRTLSKWHRFRDGSSVERHDEGIEKRAAIDWIVCENAWPAIVDVATFEAVQERRKASREGQLPHYRGNAMKSEYLLTGVIKCGVCGGKLTGNTNTSGKGIRKRYYVCARHSAGYVDECPQRYLVPAALVEDHVLGLVRRQLDAMRDERELVRHVDDLLTRARAGRSDARDQLTRRLAVLDQQLAHVREHVRHVDADTAKALGLYEQAKQVGAERADVERQLAAAGPEPSLPPLPQLRERIAAELDRMEAVLAHGTLEQRRELIACYVHSLKALPEEETVEIGLFPGALSQMVAGGGFEPPTFGL